MDDPVAALEALTKLRERGLVTEEEYAAKRTAILARLDGERSSNAHPAAGPTAPSSAPAATQPLALAPIGMTVGGVLYAVGSALPWVTATAAFVGTISRSGLEGGDGIITLGLGIIIALIGVGRMIGSKSAGSKVAAVLVCLIAVGFAVFEISNANERVASFDSDLGVASVGIGLWLMVMGSVVAALSAISLRR